MKKCNYNKIIHTAGCISKTSISIKYRNNRMLHWYKSRKKILFSLILSDYICLIYITSEQKMRRRMLGKKGSTWLQRRFVEFVPCVTLLLPRPTRSSECWSKKVKKKPYKHATSSFILHKIIAFDPLTFLKLPSPHFYHSRNSNLWVSDVHSIIRKYWMKINKFYNFNRQQTNKIFSKIIIFGH